MDAITDINDSIIDRRERIIGWCPKDPAGAADYRGRYMALVDSTQQLLEAAMRGSWQRETALTSNIANADTPGYKRQEVNFESELQSAMSNGEELGQLQFQTEVQPEEDGPNGTSVSVDQESAKLAENGLDYQALTQVISTRDNIISTAIGVAP
jgi:flagellar basal-body rod protein FlgB